MVFCSPSQRRKDLLSGPLLHGTKNNHFVQFYENNAFLVESVGHFIVSGLKANEGALIIATHENLASFSKYFEKSEVNVEDLQKSGQLIFLDAEKTLSKFLKDGSVDHELFEQEVGSLVEKINLIYPHFRIYGEMVGLLWASGKIQDTIQLEKLWNELVQKHTFSLLCGYSQDIFSDWREYSEFQTICDSHSHVFPPETYIKVTHPDDQLKVISDLAQQSSLLKIELEKRSKIENALQQSESDRKSIEIRLTQAVQARDEFLSIASHELKTPITSLKLQTQIQKRRFEKNDPASVDRANIYKLLETASRQINRISNLIDEMLDISRIKGGKLELQLEEVNLGDLVKKMVVQLEDQFQSAQCKYKKTIEGNILGRWDQFRIEQVIIHLIRNAIQYSPGCHVEISVYSEKDKAVLQVKDDGKGIETENLERIFERFERAVSPVNSSGLGLGLYICRQIVEAHQGKIWVESKIGKGSIFTVFLPLASTFQV